MRCPASKGSAVIKLEIDNSSNHTGGTVRYRVHLDGEWIGYVGDGREWRGSRYGGRRWWAAWRQDGDAYARWNTGGITCSTRTEALSDLLAIVKAGA